MMSLEKDKGALPHEKSDFVLFTNEALIAYCEQEQITFTRGRPHLKNDQCFVEQKNGAIVRQVVGYDRFVGEHAYRQLTELYRLKPAKFLCNSYSCLLHYSCPAFSFIQAASASSSACKALSRVAYAMRPSQTIPPLSKARMKERL